jgi:hypothetical protein
MKKAYDRIDWQFLDKMSESRGFGVIFRNQVKSIPLCFTINDTNSSYFMAVKGLKQGDPLSLILFNLVADVFSKMLYKVARVDSALTPPNYSSRFPLPLVDGKIPLSLLFLSGSQSKMDGDGNTHTHACKYKSISYKVAANNLICGLMPRVILGGAIILQYANGTIHFCKMIWKWLEIGNGC